MAFRVMVTMLIDVESDAEIFDVVNEILRERQRCYAPDSPLIDYMIDQPEPWEGDIVNYEEGDAFFFGGVE